MSFNGNVERLRENFKQDTVKIFMVHRRMMIELYKNFGLTSYENELILVMLMLSDFDTNTVVKGTELANVCGKRFRNVLNAMVTNLSYQGYIEDLGNEGKKAHYRLKITDKAIEFAEVFFFHLNKKLEEDRVMLIMRENKTRLKKKSNE